MLIKEQLISQLKNLQLKSGDNVMVHASLRAVGKILGGPDEIHKAIMDIISPHGTLIMYVGCEPEFEAIGRNKRLAEEDKFIFMHCPVFDPATARARRDYGAFAELFRSWPDVICSQNPGARIAAYGRKAIWFTADQPLNYGYGPGSPLAKLYDSNGKILLLGSDLDQITILHYAEHIAPIDKKRVVNFKVPLLKNRSPVWVDIEEYDTSDGIRKWPERFFEEILIRYFKSKEITPQKVGNADSYLIEAKQLVDFSIPIFLEASKIYI